MHSHDKESKLKEEKIAASHFQLGKICFECTRHTLPALYTVMHFKKPHVTYSAKSLLQSANYSLLNVASDDLG